MAIDWDNFVYPERAELIEWLCKVDQELDTELELELLRSFLQFGFKGYEAYSDQELRAEYRDRTVMRLIRSGA